MLEQKVKFECENNRDIVQNSELVQQFWDSFYKQYAKEYCPDVFTKVGGLFEPIPFTFNINYRPSRNGNIHEIDDVKFVGDALKEIKNYRMIDDTIYKVELKRGIIEGQSLITVKNEPLFIINTTKVGNYTQDYWPISFKFNNNRGFLTYNTNIENAGSNPTVEMEIKIENKRKEKILLNIFNHVVELYEEKGIKATQS